MIERLEWLIEGRVILAKVVGEITLEKTQDMFDQVGRMIASKGEPPYVHVLYDVRQRGPISPDMLRLGQLSRLTGEVGMVGWVIIVDSQPHIIMRSLAHILAQMSKLRLRIFTNMQEATRFLTDIDKTLSPLEIELN